MSDKDYQRKSFYKRKTMYQKLNPEQTFYQNYLINEINKQINVHNTCK